MKNEYIDLIKKVLIDYNRSDLSELRLIQRYTPNFRGKVLKIIAKLLRMRDIHLGLMTEAKDLAEIRAGGRDWPTKAESMIGLKRMDNIQFCIENILKNNIPGDLIETGVWRGGASIFMKAILKANNINDRKVYLADSFAGLPKPDPKYAADNNDIHHTFDELAVSLEVVKNNFLKYDLLDDNVVFLKGWFKDTLPSLKDEQFALLRLDGDMYASTMDALTNLYPTLSKGGYIIIDDWGAVPASKVATNDYRREHNISDEIKDIDGVGVYWQKS